MAVYTHLSFADLQAWLGQHYTIGLLHAFHPIAEGVENSNYLLEMADGSTPPVLTRYILTLYEKRVQEEDLPFFLGLKQHLAAKGFSCPRPIEGREGALVHTISGKHAAITSFLQGRPLARMGNAEIASLGQQVARLHQAAQGFPLERMNDLSPDRLGEVYRKVDLRLPELLESSERHAVIADEVKQMRRWQSLDLPRGIIHADIFPDNVFFRQGQVSGIIDFYFACREYLIFDLAICLNAWCFERGAEFNITKAQHLLSAYHKIRPLSAQELDALPFLARGAALRFFLTRAHDWLFPVEGAVVTVKDPMEYFAKWQFHYRTPTYRGYIL